MSNHVFLLYSFIILTGEGPVSRLTALRKAIIGCGVKLCRVDLHTIAFGKGCPFFFFAKCILICHFTLFSGAYISGQRFFFFFFLINPIKLVERITGLPLVSDLPSDSLHSTSIFTFRANKLAYLYGMDVLRWGKLKMIFL